MGPHIWVTGMVHEIIIDRLKNLNVVVAETTKGKLEQANRMIPGDEPRPDVRVAGEVDDFDEMRSLWSWAYGYPQSALDLVRKAGSEGISRALAPIPTYN